MGAGVIAAKASTTHGQGVAPVATPDVMRPACDPGDPCSAAAASARRGAIGRGRLRRAFELCSRLSSRQGAARSSAGRMVRLRPKGGAQMGVFRSRITPQRLRVGRSGDRDRLVVAVQLGWLTLEGTVFRLKAGAGAARSVRSGVIGQD